MKRVEARSAPRSNLVASALTAVKLVTQSPRSRYQRQREEIWLHGIVCSLCSRLAFAALARPRRPHAVAYGLAHPDREQQEENCGTDNRQDQQTNCSTHGCLPGVYGPLS